MITLRFTTTVLFSIALSTPVWAQDDQTCMFGDFFGEEGCVLDEIVISAGLGTRPVSAATYGRSHTTLTAKQIAQRGYTTVEQALASVPGVSVTRTDTSMTEVRMRGGETNMVSVLIDGVKASTGYNGAYYFNGIDISDIERIEVLRGPQSVIGGANAASGVISITTRRGSGPGLRQQTSVGYGSHGTYHGNYNAQIVGRRGKVAFSITRDHDGGYDVSGDDGERDETTTTTATLTGRYEVSDALTAGVVLRRSRQTYDYDTTPGATTEAGYVVDAATEGVRNETFGQLWLGVDSLGGRLTHRLGYSGTDQKRNNYKMPGMFWWSDQSRYRSLEYRATLALDAATVGAARQTLSLAAQNETQRFTSGTTPYHRTTRSAALEYSGDFPGGIGVQAGVRRIYNEVFKNGTSWNLALSDAIPNTDLRLHGSIGTSIVNPDMYEQYGYVPGVYEGNPDLRPETVHGADLGVEWTSGERGSLDVTVFHQTVRDQITGSGSTSSNSPGKSRARGVEISGNYQVTDILDLGLEYTYTDARDSSGKPLVRRPKHRLGLDATWTVLRGQGSLTLGIRHVSGNYDKQFWITPPIIAKTPDYTLVNLSGRYAVHDRLDLVGRLDNMTDVDHSEVWGYASRGRSAYLGLEAKW